MTPGCDVLRRESQGPARGHLELQPHDVDTGHRLRHRVLHLQPGVHLEERECAIGSQEELDGPRVDVVRRSSGRDAGRAEGLTLVLGKRRAGRLFDDLLMPTLDRALPLSQVQDRPLPIVDDLDLDVPGPVEAPLDEHRVVVKSGFRFAT